MKYPMIVLILVCLSAKANAQVSQDSELFIELKKMDSLLFEQGFNRCNHVATLKAVKPDVKFYHDTGGLTTTADALLTDIKNNICGHDYKMRRALVPGSLEVYALKDGDSLYGAIQKGEHRFYIRPPGKEEFLTGSALFTHVWERTHDGWKLATVLSYNHGPATSAEAK